MMIKRLSISDLQYRRNSLKATKKITGNTRFIREQLGAIEAELKCRYNPSVRKTL